MLIARRHTNTANQDTLPNTSKQGNTLATILAKTNHLSPTWQRRYVNTMFAVIAKALVASSQYEKLIQQELHGFPSGLTLRMTIAHQANPKQTTPQPIGFTLQVTDNHQFTLLKDAPTADVTIYFKHYQLAFLVLTFQESTAQAFANDRMTIDGDIGYAVRFVRILNQLEAIILPKLLASRAVKRYPTLPLLEKFTAANRIYRTTIKQFLIR